MKSSNPMLRNIRNIVDTSIETKAMNPAGAANKASILLVLVFVTALFSWVQAASSGVSGLLMTTSIIGALGLAIATAFKPQWSPVTAPLYAVLEGFALGSISFTFEVMYPGIAIQAVIGTMSVALVMLLLYQTRIIKVTARFRSMVTMAVIAVGVVYFLSFIVSFFAPQLSVIGRGGTLGIVISAVIIIVAALALLLDFDMIERVAQSKAPKYMEWYCAFSLLVTLVWLYVEMLRLISLLRSDE